MNTRQVFQQFLAQTSPAPIGLHIQQAKGNYLIDVDGKSYLDLIGGISVCNIGHSHPKVVEAIQQQSQQYLHIMVYGELVQTPQLAFGQAIIQHMPTTLNSVYFTNSGSEACEAAIKLCRRANSRPNIIAANNSYHGHSTGSLAVMGSEYWRNAFRPLMPGVFHFDYNSEKMLAAIDEDCSCVIVEAVQSEAGIIKPNLEWLKKLRQKCSDLGVLLILDEIQTGFGRTGSIWAFEQLGIVPDIVLLGKALGGGMPMGAVVANRDLMNQFTHNPVLGHMTTFGGHPLCCAAGLAAFEVLLQEALIEHIKEKETLFHTLLKHPKIKAVRSAGLLMAVELSNNKMVLEVLEKCLGKGLFSDWFLFADNCIRIAPPLSISLEEIEWACTSLLSCLDGLEN